MPILALLNEKGGVGKTTLTSNLGRGLQLRGERVRLIDSDPQGSLRDWYVLGNDLPPLVSMDRAAMFKSFEAGDGWMIIDTPPGISEMQPAILKITSHVLIPVQPSPYDVWAAESLVGLVKARQRSGELEAAFVVSRQIPNTKLAREVQNALADYVPVLQAYTCQRVIYAHSAAKGLSVLDAEPGGAAAKEINMLIEEIITWTNDASQR